MKTQIYSIAKNTRISPEKVKLIVNEIKKMKPSQAVKILDFVPNKGALILKKVINSAIANARNNHNLDETSLTFKEIIINKGITFKRHQPGSRGRAMPIIKRTSHIKVVLQGEEAKKKETETKQLTDKEKNGTKS